MSAKDNKEESNNCCCIPPSREKRKNALDKYAVAELCNNKDLKPRTLRTFLKSALRGDKDFDTEDREYFLSIK